MKPKPPEELVRVNIRIPKSLFEQIATYAQENYTSVNRELVEGAKCRLNQLGKRQQPSAS